MKKIAAFCLTLLIVGCTTTGRHYLRNMTDNDALITISFDNAIQISDSTNSRYVYEPKLKTIKFALYKRLKQNLKVIQLSNKQLQFTLPAKSTAYLGVGQNTRLWGFNSITIQSLNSVDTMNCKNSEELIIKRHGLLSYTAHYDIK